MSEKNEGKTKTFTEELEVAGSQLVERVQELIKEGNVRRIIIKSADDAVILETSLTIGAVAGGVLMMSPVGLTLTILGTIAAVAARVKIEIVREITDGTDTVKSKQKIDIESEE